MRFQDKVVGVTGASRGSGREIAAAFAREGAKVACVATSQEGADKTAAEIGGKGYACDVSNSEQVEQVFTAIVDELGTPTVLVNNAGIARDNLMMRLKDDDWDRVLDVNLKGAFLCIK